MASGGPKPRNVDEYIALFPADVQNVLQKIRLTVENVAPESEETISYGMPTFKLNGVLVHFAAFKKHIGFYPPVRGDAELEMALSRYAGEKGSLRFPLDEAMPYGLIERIVKLRARQNLDNARTK